MMVILSPQNTPPVYSNTRFVSSSINIPRYRQNPGQKIAETAKQFWNQSSRHGPDRGNLACAFMVNEVLKTALGKVYGLDPTTVNSVRTDLLYQGGKIVPPFQAKPGDLALTFNEASLKGIGGATAHIGIVIVPNTIL
nr:TolB-like 6-bladed beta-propeller domain-containing protein [Vampirovibrio sp.]